ncbi:major facilitator superfamily domain-containing protein [Lentinula detonsa]|uniref:Major facilitator superfamily domain-containing protein n=1 Tax=Lentinula detonsa TaxID=2804962 RepID=A0A9W8TUQ5_9AGAR|nr:major facilitator superfamily domain-containing protein [Lentinula detonsa]
MSATTKGISDIQDLQHIEETPKDLYSLNSQSTHRTAPGAGIDAEVAEFFATLAPKSHKPIVIDDATNRRLRWMIHKRVLVVMTRGKFFPVLIEAHYPNPRSFRTMSFASIMGITTDTHLIGQQYAWLTTCVYIAILLWEFPTNRLIQRLPIAKYLAFSISAWGAVLACSAACTNFTGLVIVRTLLGIFECVCQPAFVFLSTMWYTREEQALVIGSFYSMNGFQQCVGGLIAYGIAHIQHAKLYNWQILFTLLGCITFVWGIFVAWWLPDSPMRAKCFSPEDRILMAERVRKNQTGLQNREFKMYQAVEALGDPIVWSVTLISFTNGLPTGGLGAFSNLIITAFGYSQLQTYLLAIAQGAIIMAALFSGAYLSKRYGQKLVLAFVSTGQFNSEIRNINSHIQVYTLPNIAGTIVFLSVPTTSETRIGLLIAFYCTQVFGAVAVLNLAVMSGNVAGRTKQVVASSLVFIAWATGNAAGPQGEANDSPRYVKAFIAHIIIYGIQLAVIVFLRLHLMRRNQVKRRAQSLQETSEDLNVNLYDKRGFEDLTDKENPDFRYLY